MARLSLMIDLERCIGCKSCEVACKQEHGLGPSENRNKVIWLGAPDRPALDFLTVACQHCDRPACLRACPVNPKAISKDLNTGVVTVNEDLCTGCGECVTACPYGAMGYDPVDHHAVKCDLCNYASGTLAPLSRGTLHCTGGSGNNESASTNTERSSTQLLSSQKLGTAMKLLDLDICIVRYSSCT